jgi:small subunit ribosomal protein S1
MTAEKPGEDFASLLQEFDRKAPRRGRREVEVGQMVRGRVVSIGREQAFVDLGSTKAEAVIDLVELRDSRGALTVAVGDEIEARVVATSEDEGSVVLRRTFGRGPEAKAELEQAFAMNASVEGTVVATNKGGVEVEVAGVRAFCPLSQLDNRRVEDPAAFVGQKLTFKITRHEADARGMNVVLSRRAVLEEAGRAEAVKTRAQLVVGAVLPGIVTTLKDYGAFVDLGGIEGMLHVSEIGHTRTDRPSDVLMPGQRLDVQILKIEKTGDPKRPEKISLSLKALANDPWDSVAERFRAGDKVKGTVTRVEAFGAFVELAPGVEGLIPISEMGTPRPIRHARDVVKPGQPVDMTVLTVDRDRRRLSLGLGDREDAARPEDLAAARGSSVPGRLGTIGDLLKNRKL